MMTSLKFIAQSSDQLLSTVTQKTGLDLEYILKNSWYTGLRQLSGVFSGLILTIILAHTTTQEFVGQYNFVQSILSIAALFTLPGMNTAILKSATEEKYGDLLRGMLLRLLPAILASWGAAYFITSQTDLDFSLAFISLILITFPFITAFDVSTQYLIGRQRFDLAARLDSWVSVSRFIGQVIALFIFKSVVAVLAAYLIITSLFYLVSFFVLQRQRPNTHTNPQLFSHGLTITLTSALNYIAKHLDKFIIGFYSGPGQLAIYAVAKTIPEGLTSNSKVFLHIPLIRLIPKSPHKGAQAIFIHRSKLFLIGLLLSAVCWVTFPLLYPLLFSLDYTDSIKTAQILSLSLIFFPFNSLTSHLISYQDRRKHIIYHSLFSNLPKIILYISLLHVYGLVGIAVAQVISEILGTLYLLFFVTMEKPKEFESN